MFYFRKMSLKRYLDKYSFYRLNAIKMSKSVEIGEELVQELFLILMEKDKKLLKKLADENKAEAYCLKIMKTQLYSKNTNFYKSEISWRKNRDSDSFNINKIDNKAIEKEKEIDFIKMVEIEKVDLLIKRLPYFEREVFRVYYSEGLSLNRFAKKSGISRKTIYNTINKVKNYIKENYK